MTLQDGEVLCFFITFTFKLDGTIDSVNEATVDGVTVNSDFSEGTYRFIGSDESIIELCFDDECLNFRTDQLTETSFVFDSTSPSQIDGCDSFLRATKR